MGWALGRVFHSAWRRSPAQPTGSQLVQKLALVKLLRNANPHPTLLLSLNLFFLFKSLIWLGLSCAFPALTCFFFSKSWKSCFWVCASLGFLALTCFFFLKAWKSCFWVCASLGFPEALNLTFLFKSLRVRKKHVEHSLILDSNHRALHESGLLVGC